MPHKRRQAVDRSKGESERPNPASAAIWHYDKFDFNGDGKIELEERMHRSCGSVAIKDDLLFIADFSGIVHCVNARTGKPNWTHDLFAASHAVLPLIVDGKVYITDEDGDVAIFELSAKKKLINEVNMGNAVYGTPIVANNVLYIASKDTLYAIAAE
jgi:outer membrane protein assembly factor BamB